MLQVDFHRDGYHMTPFSISPPCPPPARSLRPSTPRSSRGTPPWDTPSWVTPPSGLVPSIR
eukprot:1391184-Amorphochlora_amoeboformis.AAC.1